MYFNEVFSLVLKHHSIHILLFMVVILDLELKQLDVKIVFLHGEFDKQIYMHQLKGFVVSSKENHIYLLKKSLYNLKQSLRQWYKRFDTFMLAHDFSRSRYDSCVYFK